MNTFVRKFQRLVLALSCIIGFSMVQPAMAETIWTAPKAVNANSDLLVKVQQRRSLFRFLFRGNKRRQTVRQSTQPRVQKRAPRRATPVAPIVPQIEKDAGANRILIIGDFFGATIARGLALAFAQDRMVAIDVATNGSSGLVRSDVFNWNSHITKVIDDPDLGGRADLIVIMIGGNDRQKFRSPKAIGLNTPEWTKEYESRVTDFTAQLAGLNKPIIWVGLPPVAGPKTTAHLAKISSIFSTVSQDYNGRFIDIWDEFANADGTYNAKGADINGIIVTLRNKDGFGFSKAGTEKLTFFVKRQVDRFLTGVGAVVGTPGGIIQTEHGPALSLTGFALEDAAMVKGGDPLIGPPMKPENRTLETTLSYNALVVGNAQIAPQDRVDNFAWPATQ